MANGSNGGNATAYGDARGLTATFAELAAAPAAQAAKAGAAGGGGASGTDGGGKKPEGPKKVASSPPPSKEVQTAAPPVAPTPRGRERGSDLEKLGVAELRERLTPLGDLLAEYDTLKVEVDRERTAFRAAREESKKFEDEIRQLEVKYVDILRGPKGPQRDHIIGQLLARRVLVAKLYIGGKEDDDPDARQGYEVYRLVQDIRAAISEGGDFGAFGRMLRAAVEKGFYEVIEPVRYAKEKERGRGRLAFHFSGKIYFPVKYERRRIQWLRSELLYLKHEAVQRADADREEEYQLLETIRAPRNLHALLDPNGVLPEESVSFAVFVDTATIKKGNQKIFIALERDREDGSRRSFSGAISVEIAADPLVAGRKQITVRKATGSMPYFFPRSKNGVVSSTMYPPVPRGSKDPQTAIWARKLLKFLWEVDTDGIEQLRLAWREDRIIARWIEKHHPAPPPPKKDNKKDKTTKATGKK